jgi:hypothetical protein
VVCMGENRNTYCIWGGGGLKDTDHLKKTNRRWEDSIKLDLKQKCVVRVRGGGLGRFGSGFGPLWERDYTAINSAFQLTLNPPTWNIWRAPNNASR